MSNHWSAIWPRNTSNGEYGRFFYPGGSQSSQDVSQDGVEITQEQVHYPNCQHYRKPASHGQGRGQGGQPQNQKGLANYTVEYGEDAVRAVLGEMPDFQAQFQKQYGNGGGDAFKVSPEQMQMVNGGKAKVAMLPVVISSDDGDGPQIQPQIQPQTPQPAPVAEEAQAPQQEPTPAPEPVVKERLPKSENVLKAMDSVRQRRAAGPVKYGRHVRPSYWNPEAPNPCRKNLAGPIPAPNGNAQTDQAPVPAHPSDSAARPNYFPQQYNEIRDSPNPSPINPAVAEAKAQMPTRGRSVPPAKGAVSLCGKCHKCKKLSGKDEPTVLTFPKYSTGAAVGIVRSRSQQPNTSSNLSQSAKNFRAIRFSSNQHHAHGFM